MSILLNALTRIVFYGADTPHGARQRKALCESGALLVASVGQEGPSGPGSKAVYTTAREAVSSSGIIDLAVIFSPPARVLEDTKDALAANIRSILITTEYVPVHDALELKALSHAAGAVLVGPNSSGILTPGEARAGFICNSICIPGRVGVVAKSGSVTFAAMSEMKFAGLGVSTVASIGGDLVKGTDYRRLLDLFERDPETDCVLILGEVGGADEELAAAHIAKHIGKPVVAFVSGRLVKPGQNIGHAGAIVTQGRGGYEGKVRAFKEAGVSVAEQFSDIVPMLLRCPAPRTARR
ncbi:succinate--CoA ligase subunit alpha [Sinorhizobium mexicanum]|uniref:Succinate--CoA ligase subunit alpha n=1 Tax=Sinorhizobium mexicanum TaxID=375549 RepID=A0A859QEK0_9HYPH|nr:succinate--CoA ligase subunit alpha [Sinorhizobium mexicanum]MBP1881756.1 succinyl-CoA synthetase alpha subunit [Sinorhizobium mexicanum]QLL61514.1 succinate--CoA ligase subunit alpha [Sinorhizobium mexicanum]